MAREAVIDSMAQYKGYVLSSVSDTVEKIIALCEELRRYGKEFTFDKDADIEQQVKALLLALSNAILDEIREKSRKATEEADYDDDEAVWLFVSGTKGDQDLTQRIDSYSSHLFFLLEGWLAIGYANKLTQNEIKLDVIGYRNPEASELWREAIKDGSYASVTLKPGEFHFGKGTAIDPTQGLTLAGQDAIMQSFTYGSVKHFQADGAIGYMVRRGSTYDCPYCDDHTGIVYPFDTIVLPLHPRCCCYPVPVYPK